MRMRFRHARDVRGRLSLFVAMMMVVGLVTAPSAPAKEPTGEYAVFKQCPRYAAGVTLCLYGQVTNGEMILNRLSVPIVNTVTLQFGFFAQQGTPVEKVVGALDGETLSPTPQPVPGGLASLIACDEIPGNGHRHSYLRRACRGLLERSRLAGVTATTELAAPASDIYLNTGNELALEGTALALPVKIHLENPLLGRSCYIGSDTNPIVFNLTSGTTNPPPPNKPIKGKIGNLVFQDEFNLIEATDHIQVDNAFPAPEATGCGFGPRSSIDELIDNRIGLPSPAGYNTIIHIGTADEGTAEAIIASEQEAPGEKRH